MMMLQHQRQNSCCPRQSLSDKGGMERWSTVLHTIPVFANLMFDLSKHLYTVPSGHAYNFELRTLLRTLLIPHCQDI